MGHFEDRSRTRARRGQIQALVLGSAFLAGGIAVALVAPNVLGALRKVGLTLKQRHGEHVTFARRQLKRAGALIEKDGYLRITPKGLRRLHLLTLSLATPQKQKKWDEKWRVLIFDVPEHRRKERDRIRSLLRGAGFLRVQHSVWLYPYPCEEFVALIKADIKIGNGMLYLIVDSLENDQRFRDLFHLPRSRFIPPVPTPLPKLLETLISPILPPHK